MITERRAIRRCPDQSEGSPFPTFMSCQPSRGGAGATHCLGRRSRHINHRKDPGVWGRPRDDLRARQEDFVGPSNTSGVGPTTLGAQGRPREPTRWDPWDKIASEGRRHLQEGDSQRGAAFTPKDSKSKVEPPLEAMASRSDRSDGESGDEHAPRRGLSAANAGAARLISLPPAPDGRTLNFGWKPNGVQFGRRPMRPLGPIAVVFPQGKRWSRPERSCAIPRYEPNLEPARNVGLTSWPASWGRRASNRGLRALERRPGAPPKEVTGDRNGRQLRRGRPPMGRTTCVPASKKSGRAKMPEPPSSVHDSAVERPGRSTLSLAPPSVAAAGREIRWTMT
ncbi:hypothetical protein C2845_PM03G28330 [Panicum miliaceum]|uniref:Uncharacterized protein n=1 Tax=Panicum miliaceum TaxID=4540 RepID=A0A3L6T4K6_PANMI|nr:hypothetical protein C2845_PM03G28330 [Panicum miliaceum]